MKTIEQLVHEAAESAGRAIVFDDHFKLFAERFHALAIAEEHKRLLEGSGEAAAVTLRFEGDERLCLSCVFDTVGEAEEYRDFRTTGYPDIVQLYTADQMAAAVLRERERCAKVCDEHLEFPSLTPKHCADAIRNRGTK